MKLFEMFDKVNKTKTNDVHRFKLKMFEHYNNTILFKTNLNEGDENKKQFVLSALNKNELSTTPQEFYDSLMKSKHPDMLTHYSVSDLSQMRLFKVPELNIGYALKKFDDGQYSEIVAVHNNEPDITGIGQDLIKNAVKNGGKYLDHFDGFLTQLYKNAGFEEYKRDSYNPEYDPDGKFREKYGKQDVIYRKYNG
jgi:hypothetical protein